MARRPTLAVILVALFVLAQVVAASPAGTDPSTAPLSAAAAKIDKGLLQKLEKEPGRFVVEFEAKADLQGAGKIKDHGQRGRFVYDQLTGTATKSQAAAVALVRKEQARARSYWLTNVMVVEGDARLATKLAALPGVGAIRPEKTYPLVTPVATAPAILAVAGPEWGVAKIRADAAWAEGIMGEGIVVANVDTGVDYLHPALVNQYRGNNGDGTFSHDYNWWDPTGICGDTPCDNVAHGTHTMGTMVGGDGPGEFTPDIGVAPAARWIAAKGCEEFFCTEGSLLSAGQFILAPTKLDGSEPDPSKRPDVVNNSWGGGPGDPFYLEVVQAWRAAGIIPVFASGNPGPSCGEGGSPGDFLESFSAGATDINDQIADFSGRGPSVFGKINPDVSAPGVDVVSSVPGGGYAAFSGTSMAAPHTAGTIALVLSAEPALIGDFAGATDAVRGTAFDRIDTSCGGEEDGDPNNVYGDGRIDAFAAVQLVATGGTLAGTVRDASTDDPISGATVTIHGERDFSVSTDEAGRYEAFVAAGIYPVTAEAFGYFLALAEVEIVTDQTTTQDFALDPKPRFNVTGLVRAAEDGGPIEGASVRALGTPVPAVETDATGHYDLELPIGSYTIRAAAGGCTASETAAVELIDADVTADFSLARKLDRFGHGCRPIAFDWVDAESQSALFGNEFAGRLRLPFEATFYGATYDQVFLSDNGYLNFLAADQYKPFPVAIPNMGPPNAAIYALWQDLELDESSSIDYATLGTAPTRTFVIEYSDVKVARSKARLDLEVKIHEAAETLDLLFGANPANPGDGRNATIGIENADGTDALEFSFFEGLIEPNSAYRFDLVPSGIVHGVVSDRNDGQPIAGATVAASPGLQQTATAADGTYSLRLYPGTYTVAVSARGYLGESFPLTVVNGSDETRDLSLAAPLPMVDAAEVSVTVEYGQTTTSELALSNDGSAPLGWQLFELDRGSSPPTIGGEERPGTTSWLLRTTRGVEMAANRGGKALAYPKALRWTAVQPSADTSILVYADDPYHAAPNTYVDQALRRLGLSYTAHYDGDFSGFQGDLKKGGWDLVIFEDENWFPDFSVFDALNAYVRDGGRLVLSSWVVQFDPRNPFWSTLGFQWADDDFDPPDPVHWWDPAHPAFNAPESVPEFTVLAGQRYGIYGQRGDPLEGATAIAGYTTPGPDPKAAAMIVANDDRTVFKGFMDGQNDADLDKDGVPDGAELWTNLIEGVATGFVSDVPWLSEAPTAGTLVPGAGQAIELAIGDPELSPGTYRAALLFKSDAPKPKRLLVPVTLTVALPAAFGAITGTLSDAHTGEPLASATVTVQAQWPPGTPKEISATTRGDGTYRLIGPEGTWSATFAADGYLGVTRDVAITRGTTTQGVDQALHGSQSHAALDGGPFSLVLTAGKQIHGTLTLANPEGHADLTFEVKEADLGGPGTTVAAATTAHQLPRGADPNARTTKALGDRPTVAVPPRLMVEGDILASWPTVGVDLPWGVGFTGDVWISDPLEQGDACGFMPGKPCLDAVFTPSGSPVTSFGTPWAEAWAADMAYDPVHQAVWQLNVGGDNGIYGLDPADGSVKQVITGTPWGNISQRGLAYDPDADVFYVGGWNEGIIYRVAGPDHPTPGETLSQCNPPDFAISGLAWNRSFQLLWQATNSKSDTIFLVEPSSCEVRGALAHPAGGGSNGAGLELDRAGNLWTVGQGTGTAYLVESGLPEFGDVPWLATTPANGTVAPDGGVALDVAIDTTGLVPGIYRALVVVGTNDPDHAYFSVPVTVFVPAYQQGANAGGGAYTRADQAVFAADRAYRTGVFGYLGPSSSRRIGSPIAGTDDDPLYQDLRAGMTGYRFDAPNGHYRVDLHFAELQLAKAGTRVFNVTIEGTTVLANLDVFAVAGGKNTALDYTFEVDVTDGHLDIGFVPQRGDQPIVNAILVTEWPPGFGG
ncbi:MAG: hypothetical protein A2X23_09030 [Chloroflexi bacterium GWC2_73_18]|nr:MAG: hypothetical protein A2X23_09030 [Chloroflexi bacterium GWC2_73_18]